MIKHKTKMKHDRGGKRSSEERRAEQVITTAVEQICEVEAGLARNVASSNVCRESSIAAVKRLDVSRVRSSA